MNEIIDTQGISLVFEYDFAEIEEIKRNLNILYSTKEGEQPLDREFGLNCDFVGEPLPIAQNMFSLEVVRKTAMYEPRVSVREVAFTVNENNGTLMPQIFLEEGEEEDE